MPAVPYWTQPGVEQGRRSAPIYGQPVDGEALFVLGSDSDLPQYILRVGDDMVVEQEMTVDATLVGGLLKFAWRMRTAGVTRVAGYSKIVDAAAAYALAGGVLAPSDDLQALDLGPLAAAAFDSTWHGSLVRVSGFTIAANNGDFAALGVPTAESGRDVAPAGRYLIVDNPALVNEAGAAVTIERLGLRWRAQAFVNAQLVAELVEQAGSADPDGWQRATMAANISRLALNDTFFLQFRLSLEAHT